MLSRRKTLTCLSAVTVMAGLITGCSSSSKSGDNGGSTTSSSPIKIGIITPVGAAVSYPDMVAAVKGAIRGINTAGGIAGRKVEIDFCNEALDPNKAQACARKMVSDKVIGTVGDFTVTAEAQVVKILAAGGVPAVAPYDFTSSITSDPNSYLLVGGQSYINASQIDYGLKVAGPRLAEARVDLPVTLAYRDLAKKAAPSLGGTFVTDVALSQTTTDFSPAAVTLVNSKPTIVNLNMGDNLMVPLVKQMNQLGYKGKYVQVDNALTEADIKQLGTAADQVLFTGPFPPLSESAKFPLLKQFITDMTAERAAGDNDAPDSTIYVRDAVMNAYLGTIALAKIANAAKATDSSALSAAMKAAKDVDLGGVVPNWNPNTSVSKTLPRVSNGSWFYFSWENGKPKLYSDKPTDVTSIVDSSGSS